MQPAAWIGLLRRIPLEQHDNLSLVTSIGLEMNVQTLLRLEDEYIVLRGRLAGSTDAGRVFFVPYDQINYLGFQKPIKENQVRLIFGEAPFDEEASKTVAEAEPASGSAPANEPVTSASALLEPTPHEPEAPPAAPPLPGKAALLERIRSRARNSSAVQPPR